MKPQTKEVIETLLVSLACLAVLAALGLFLWLIEDWIGL
jgi:hypothetical protein